ncbi:MAG: hypothetical protein PHQ66_03225 [Candidatus Nanoarchaeia archaeon]|nr:hypothetical protein [Candidatus Nanoarchaeia archaeon]MDD5357624.1 hypothetical protein [Candidatus Nanoarchaeia archaeon]MDD5588543.1 hypothetical protein [Candidatus Nanoarchaeia archaeon]
MAKRVVKGNNHSRLLVMKKEDEFKSRAAKRIFFIFLDIIILVSFSLTIYFTLIMDYTKVILFLVLGSLLLLYFVMRKLVKQKK